MDEELLMLFVENGVTERDITYIAREDGKTIIHLVDGRALETRRSITSLMSALTSDEYIRVNRSAMVSRRHISKISDNIYTMTDGTSFIGSEDESEEHDMNRMNLMDERGPSSNAVPWDFIDRFTVLDNMPLPFGVIEMQIEDDGTVDFTVRYCNDKMAAFWDRERKDLVGLRFDDLFRKDESGWLTSFADVAMNGETRTIREHVKRVGRTVAVHCYRPLRGYCACVIVDDRDA
ncbi:MAG: LytTR family transcriptional regulator DNA-binding domain-containing protein [Candidatus Methanomethylophilaceae archaeon]